MRKRPFTYLSVSLCLLLLASCTSSTPSENAPGSSVSARKVAASMNKEDYPVFPDADANADAAVPADMGGKGFTGAGWETNANFDLIGDPNAVKGGMYREYITDFPGTLRMAGPEHNTSTNYTITPMVYESLLHLHPTTLGFTPSLATHWQISPDKMTYRFRLNPNARWSDGQPVVADDVVATWNFFVDKGLQDPARLAQFTKFEKPVAESKYIVSVKSKELNWMNFWIFATAYILPSHVLKNVDGAAYVRDYNFKYLPGTGPYIVSDTDIRKGQSISVRRRKDYWGEKARWAAGQNNFDEVRLIVVRDSNLAFEMFKKGDLDFYFVNRSLYWVKEMNFDAVQRGVVQKRKVFNNIPRGFQGYALNTRREPYNDIRVRKALTLLQNRRLLIEKIFYNEYLPDNSYFPGGIYENPDNPKNDYDPQEAVKLLAEAGYKDRDAQGRLTKNGKPLVLEMLYDDKQFEPFLTPYQEDLRKVGITLNLRLVTFETQFKLVSDRQFEMAVLAWGQDVFPNPEIEWHSRLADVKDNDNVTGFKDPRIDEICEKYKVAFDQNERVALIRQLDKIMTEQYHYILSWYPPALRIAYWNKFGQPAGLLTRTGDHQGDTNLGPGPEQLWWTDAERTQKLEQAMQDSSMKLEVGETDSHYWQDYAKKEPSPGAVAPTSPRGRGEQAPNGKK